MKSQMESEKEAASYLSTVNKVILILIKLYAKYLQYISIVFAFYFYLSHPWQPVFSQLCNAKQLIMLL